MADPEDLAALMRGEQDLVQRDLRGANLAGASLESRDLRGAYLQKADFSSANLSGARFSGAHLAHASFELATLHRADLSSTAISFARFNGANLTEANFARSHFSKSDLSNADLRGANFAKSVINEGTSFKDAVSNDRTMFDGATIFRPLAREHAFRFYRVERGVLVRIDAVEETNMSPLEGSLLQMIGDAEAALRAASVATPPTSSESPGIGHNQPPPEAALTEEEVQTAFTTLRTLRVEVQSDQPDRKVIAEGRSRLEEWAAAIGIWVAGKAEMFTEEFAKTLGQEAAKARTWFGLWLVVSGQFQHLAHAILAAFG